MSKMLRRARDKMRRSTHDKVRRCYDHDCGDHDWDDTRCGHTVCTHANITSNVHDRGYPAVGDKER